MYIYIFKKLSQHLYIYKNIILYKLWSLFINYFNIYIYLNEIFFNEETKYKYKLILHFLIIFL